MLTRICFLFLFCLCAGLQPARAQTSISGSELRSLQVQEDSLKVLADSLINGQNPAVRLRADSQFIRTLVRSLKMKHSFYYPFDSLAGISRLYAPDSTFRILTWQYKKDDLLYLQEGAIQMNQPDGSLKLYPLFDASMFTAKPLDSVRTRRNWIGAIYYRIIEKSYQGINYYTLIGFDDFTRSSNKKWMEVLTFSRSNGEPIFGGPYISFDEDSVRKRTQYRFNIEYKKDAATRFNYDPQMDMILFDHLVPEGDDPNRKDSYIPDGDFEGFKWKDGAWVHVEKIFNVTLKDGQFPNEARLMDEGGSVNEQQLQEQSEKNIKKAEAEKNKKPKTPAKKPGN